MTDKLAIKGWNWAAIPADVILDKALNDLDVRVYGYLLWRCGKKGHAWPGEERIAEELNKSTRTIARAIQNLKSNGWIERKRRRNSSAITYILEHKSGHDKSVISRHDKFDTSRHDKFVITELESVNESKTEKNLARTERAPRAPTPLQQEQAKLESVFSELSGLPLPSGKAATIWHITTQKWAKELNGRSEEIMRAAYTAHTAPPRKLSVKGPQSIDYKFWELAQHGTGDHARELA